MLRVLLAGLFLCVCLTAADFAWSVRTGFPLPPVPADNPMTSEKVELGRHLFYDARLSVNGLQSCSSCHKQELAFTDGLATAKGTTGEIHPRSSMSLVNAAYSPVLTWAHPKLDALEDQALVPMMGTEPVELGLKGIETKMLDKLRGDQTYQRLFSAAFRGTPEPYTTKNVTRALASFERSIISTRSPYDRYRYGGESNAISPAAKRGEILFFSSEKAGCFQCHGGWNFSGSLRVAGDAPTQPEYHNTGLYNLPGLTSYPERNTGLHQHTGASGDVGKFRAPTLRNVEVTAPYMHDGSIRTLEDVIEHYASGGRAPGNPNKSVILRGFTLTMNEKHDLVEFLRTLTDKDLLSDRRWSNPWKPATVRSDQP